jgi:hypothetical protein
MKKITFNKACKLNGIDKSYPDRTSFFLAGYNTAVDVANKKITKLKKKIKKLEKVKEGKVKEGKTSRLNEGQEKGNNKIVLTPKPVIQPASQTPQVKPGIPDFEFTPPPPPSPPPSRFLKEGQEPPNPPTFRDHSGNML